MNQVGVPVANCSAMSVEASASLVTATAWMDEGRAEKSSRVASALNATCQSISRAIPVASLTG